MGGVLMRVDRGRDKGDMEDANWQIPIGCTPKGGSLGCLMGGSKGFHGDLNFNPLIQG